MLFKLIVFSGFAGVTVLIGGLLANYFNHHIKESPVKYEVTHTMMSFGAGIILAAVALVGKCQDIVDTFVSGHRLQSNGIIVS
jgi:ZIP family zinc transporter